MDDSKLNLCLFSLLTLLASQIIVVAEPQIPCFFIFGDSLSDDGNNINRPTIAKANYLPYGIDFSEGPTGRCSNSRILVDVLAEMFGFDKYIPPFANITNQDILRGVNYASGGAGIFDETGRRQLGDIISFNEQLSNHEVIVSLITELLGDERAAKEYLRTCIYFVDMCSNDYVYDYFPQLYSSSTQYTPQQFAEIVIAQYSKQLRRLYDSGARKVAVNELHKLGSLLQLRETYGSPEIGDNAARIFNENLKLLINDLNDQLLDAKFLYTRDRTAASYGYFKNVNDSCCQRNSTGLCIQESVPCNNRDEYMYWDGFHPTDAANVIFGKIAYNSMSPLFANHIDI